ncbi:MAG TPA: ABC transporter permease subunit [Ferrovibrio sp.]|uniref:ABC transporter permease n=1 Tax=Ferrovibrio sp. TaxID=1917215 RepID=UPI002ED103DF
MTAHADTVSGHSRFNWRGLFSLVLLFVVWQGVAMLVADPAIFPSALDTLRAGYVHFIDGSLVVNIAVTLLRVTVAFLLAMIFGSAIGIMLGRSPRLDAFFEGWQMIALNMPALVTIVLCYIWFGLGETAAILAVTINKIPTVVAIMREGARALDRSLLEMAGAFGMPRRRLLVHIILPQLAPSLLASARASLALTWKIVLMVELLGRPNGVGFQIRTFFNYFDIASILAYAMSFIAVVIAIEACILQPIDRSLNHWRRL